MNHFYTISIQKWCLVTNKIMIQIILQNDYDTKQLLKDEKKMNQIDNFITKERHISFQVKEPSAFTMAAGQMALTFYFFIFLSIYIRHDR